MKFSSMVMLEPCLFSYDLSALSRSCQGAGDKLVKTDARFIQRNIPVSLHPSFIVPVCLTISRKAEYHFLQSHHLIDHICLFYKLFCFMEISKNKKDFKVL